MNWEELGKLWIGLVGLTFFVWLFAYVKRNWFDLTESK